MSQPEPEADRDYYTASEAMKRLGLSRTTFHQYVNEGLIPRLLRPGAKRGVYPKRDIDALALTMNLALRVHERIIFSRSTPGDQVEEMDIGIRCFGSEFITPLAERIAFQRKSEHTFWSLKVDGRVVGYLSLFRLPPALLDDLLTGRHIERDIRVEDVLPFTRIEPFDIYIDVLAIDPRLDPHLRSFYASLIISRIADVLLDFLANGYQIEHLYTVTATREGDNLVRKLGFQQLADKSLVPGRVAYVFPLDEAGIARLRSLSRRGIYVTRRREDSPRS
ncbi:MAG: helix-turn-helix domain-containing protein [Thermogemmatispora sp.]|uniref:helix-turn-helix transcriptional regulator n=1 Tax=Thermogemmatispora TaxID=768669 RepID=UPI000852D0F0|nr:MULTISPECIES: helix-turn-helix domain-containing protein [Thermogemmatispora]MBE3568361.1 helix-turn-helix domain-containing protein [Thermogemmatispora sp.]